MEPGSPVPESPAFELSFELTADDLERFAEHMALNGEFYLQQMNVARRLMVALFAMAAFLFAVLERDPVATIIMTFALAVVGVVLWFTWPSRWRSVLRRQSRRQAALENTTVLLGPKRYTIDAEGVSFSGVYSGGYVLWPAVTRITADEATIYLHVTQASAHILPRRAFGSAADAERFLALVRSWGSVK